MNIKSFRNFINEAKTPLETVKDLVVKNKKIDSELYTLVCNDIEVVKYLIENGLDVDMNKGLPLLSASKNGKKDIVDLLIKNGANLLIDDLRIFKFICRLCKNDMIEYLVSKLYRNSLHKDTNFYKKLKSFVASSESVSGESKKQTIDLIESLASKNC